MQVCHFDVFRCRGWIELFGHLIIFFKNAVLFFILYKPTSRATMITNPFLPKRWIVWRRRFYLKILINRVVNLSLFFACCRPVPWRLLHRRLERSFTVASVTGMTKHGAPTCNNNIRFKFIFSVTNFEFLLIVSDLF